MRRGSTLPARTPSRTMTPQVTFMPRVGVSFPVTDRALFFASYNVTSQRPTERAFTPFRTFEELTGRRTRARRTRPEPERTTQYELGFRQRVGERAALTLSGFYRTQENKISQPAAPGGLPGLRDLPQPRLHDDEGRRVRVSTSDGRTTSPSTRTTRSPSRRAPVPTPRPRPTSCGAGPSSRTSSAPPTSTSGTPSTSPSTTASAPMRAR